MSLQTDRNRNILFCGIMASLLLCLMLLLWRPTVGAGHTSEEGAGQDGQHQHNEADSFEQAKPLGVEEHLGKTIPMDLLFVDEENTPVLLKELIQKPTLILPVYFHCPDRCPLLISNLADALNDVVFKAGQDFQVIIFSFDPDDTPEYAFKAKENYSQLLDKDFPPSAWRFLTGGRGAIEGLTGAMGFGYQQTAKHFFNHPSVLVVTSASGKITRYVYGPDFLPFDISMALSEAAKGTPGVSIKKLLTFCFSYDPAGKKYVFNTFKIVAISTLVIIVLFYFFVLRKGNK